MDFELNSTDEWLPFRVLNAGAVVTDLDAADFTSISYSSSGGVAGSYSSLTDGSLGDSHAEALIINAGNGDYWLGLKDAALTTAGSVLHTFEMADSANVAIVPPVRVVDPATYKATAVTVSDKAGFSLSSAGVLAIWNQLTSGLLTADTIGKLIVDNLNTTVGSRLSNTDFVAAVAAGFALTSAEREAVANKVEQEIIDESDPEKVLEAITNKIASVNPDLGGLTTSTIAAAVWNRLLTSITTAGSIGELVKTNLDTNVGSRSTVAATWDALTADLDTDDSVGKGLVAALSEIASVLAVSNKLDSGLQSDGGTGYQATTKFLENAPGGAGAVEGDGANEVTVHVIDQDAENLESASWKMTKGADKREGATPASGQVKAGVNSGTWKLIIAINGYTMTAATRNGSPVTIESGAVAIDAEVSGDDTFVITMTRNVPTSIDPNFATYQGRVKNKQTYVADTDVFFEVTALPVDSGLLDINDVEKFTSDENGYIHPALLKGASYSYWVTDRAQANEVKVAADAVDGTKLKPLVVK